MACKMRGRVAEQEGKERRGRNNWLKRQGRIKVIEMKRGGVKEKRRQSSSYNEG